MPECVRCFQGSTVTNGLRSRLLLWECALFPCLFLKGYFCISFWRPFRWKRADCPFFPCEIMYKDLPDVHSK